jgi:hypothetical protein
MTETEKDKLYKQHIRNGNLYIELAVRFINDSIHFVIMEGECPFQMNGMDRFYFTLSNSAYDSSGKNEFNISTWKGRFNDEEYSTKTIWHDEKVTFNPDVAGRGFCGNERPRRAHGTDAYTGDDTTRVGK